MKTALLLLPILALFLAGCGVKGEKSQAFQVYATSYAVRSDAKIAIRGNAIAFLADEHDTGTAASGGTILNADGDKDDQVAVVVDAVGRGETNVGVAARDIAWIGDELYLIVSELEDGRTWNPDSDMEDVVLVHWSFGDPTPRFVDTLDTTGAIQMIAVGSRLFFASASSPLLGLESSLAYVTTSAPLAPVPVATTHAGGPLRPEILGQDEGLVFLGLRETAETGNLNNDLAQDGDLVLALLDGQSATSVIRPVSLAIPGAGAPFRAKRVAEGDWQVGFLVNEHAQGETNLNSPDLFAMGWLPPQCAADADTDTDDDVLCYLRFAAWVQDPLANPPRNTGLVGTQRIAIANGFIATITPEAGAPDTLGEGTCDLNGDGDKEDKIARWAPIVAGSGDILPLNAAGNLHALFDVPGGTHGLAELQNRFVIVASETADDRDLDGDGHELFNLLGWLLPSTSAAAWQFRHTSSNSPVGATWVGEQRNTDRLGVALQEIVGGVSLNAGSSQNPGDLDVADSVPTFPFFTSVSVLTFPGVGIAVDPANAGIVIARDVGFYRVSEHDDGRDWDHDGDVDDMILWRTTLDKGLSSINGVLNAAPRASIEINRAEGSPACAAFIIEESKEGPLGTDVDQDGDRTDFVIQYFRFDG